MGSALAQQEAGPGELLLSFCPDAPQGVLSLSSAGDLAEAEANLYHMLREADAAQPTRIAVMPIAEEGPGQAINDRLIRAAAPRC